jgi:aspartate carbamoyltransferase catalytic subunit
MATEREYARCFGLNEKRVRLAKDDVVIMHPGPDESRGGNFP